MTGLTWRPVQLADIGAQPRATALAASPSMATVSQTRTSSSSTLARAHSQWLTPARTPTALNSCVCSWNEISSHILTVSFCSSSALSPPPGSMAVTSSSARSLKAWNSSLPLVRTCHGRSRISTDAVPQKTRQLAATIAPSSQ